MDVFWSMIIFFFWVIWIWIVITVLIDVFRRQDIGGFAKAAWVIFVVILPWLGVLIYLIAEHDGMQKRSMDQARRRSRRSTVRCAPRGGGGTAAEIAKAKELLDSGAITQAEFESLKARRSRRPGHPHGAAERSAGGAHPQRGWAPASLSATASRTACTTVASNWLPAHRAAPAPPLGRQRGAIERSSSSRSRSRST